MYLVYVYFFWTAVSYFWKPTAIDGGRGAADLVAKSIAFDQCIMESLEEFNLTELSGRTTHSVEWPLGNPGKGWLGWGVRKNLGPVSGDVMKIWGKNHMNHGVEAFNRLKQQQQEVEARGVSFPLTIQSKNKRLGGGLFDMVYIF